MKPNRRIAQVNELLREEIGKLMLKENSDPVLPWLTVTEVRTSQDLSSARVYVMCRQRDPEEEQIGTPEDLEYAAKVVQRLIGDRIRLKKTPHLHFKLDDTEEKAARIEDLLNQVKEDWENVERDS